MMNETNNTKETKKEKQAFYCAEDVAKAAKPVYKKWGWCQECFVAFLLDAKHCQIGKPVIVAVGSASGVEVHPRDTFRQAVKANATAIILSHNHPSGSTSPSQADKDLTTRLAQAGKLLGITVLDHVIVTKTDNFSFADNGIL